MTRGKRQSLYQMMRESWLPICRTRAHWAGSIFALSWAAKSRYGRSDTNTGRALGQAHSQSTHIVATSVANEAFSWRR